jgi:hypothetical protein
MANMHLPIACRVSSFESLRATSAALRLHRFAQRRKQSRMENDVSSGVVASLHGAPAAMRGLDAHTVSYIAIHVSQTSKLTYAPWQRRGSSKQRSARWETYQANGKKVPMPPTRVAAATTKLTIRLHVASDVSDYYPSHAFGLPRDARTKHLRTPWRADSLVMVMVCGRGLIAAPKRRSRRVLCWVNSSKSSQRKSSSCLARLSPVFMRGCFWDRTALGNPLWTSWID